MDNIVIRYLDHPKLEDPIFIEGLPGIGNVGKLAAEHLKDELKGVKFAEIFSKYFPPQVLVQDDGQVKLVNNEMHYVKRNNGTDLILLTGDYQGLTPEGQYELSDFILKELQKLGVRRVFTLGGYGMGRMVTKPRVLGAATGLELVKEMEKYGVVFSRGEPGAGIVGASGPLLGLRRLSDMEAVCLLDGADGVREVEDGRPVPRCRGDGGSPARRRGHPGRGRRRDGGEERPPPSRRVPRTGAESGARVRVVRGSPPERGARPLHYPDSSGRRADALRPRDRRFHLALEVPRSEGKGHGDCRAHGPRRHRVRDLRVRLRRRERCGSARGARVSDLSERLPVRDAISPEGQ